MSKSMGKTAYSTLPSHGALFPKPVMEERPTTRCRQCGRIFPRLCGTRIRLGKASTGMPAGTKASFCPSWRSMGTRDDQGDVVCLSGPTEFLHLCLNNGQEFIHRQAPIFSDELDEPHFAILLTLWIRCLGHSV